MGHLVGLLIQNLGEGAISDRSTIWLDFILGS